MKPRNLPDTYEEAKYSITRWTEAGGYVSRMIATVTKFNYEIFLMKYGGGMEHRSHCAKDGDISRLKKTFLAKHRSTQQNVFPDADAKVAHVTLDFPHLSLPQLRSLPVPFQRCAINCVRNRVIRKVYINIDGKLAALRREKPAETKQQHSPIEERQQLVGLVKDFMGMSHSGKSNATIAIMSSWLSDCDLDELYSRHNPAYVAVARELRNLMLTSIDCGPYTTWRYSSLSKEDKLTVMINMMYLWVNDDHGTPDQMIGGHLRSFLAEVEKYHSV